VRDGETAPFLFTVTHRSSPVSSCSTIFLMWCPGTMRILPWLLAALVVVPLSAWGDTGHRVVSILALPIATSRSRAWFNGREAGGVDHASDPDSLEAGQEGGTPPFPGHGALRRSGPPPPHLEEAKAKGRGRLLPSGSPCPGSSRTAGGDLVNAFRDW